MKVVILRKTLQEQKLIPLFTDDNGDYRFDNLLPGIYFVVETQPEDFVNVSEEDFSDDDSSRFCGCVKR